MVFARNLMLVSRTRQRAIKRAEKDKDSDQNQEANAEAASISRPHRVDSSAKRVPWS